MTEVRLILKRDGKEFQCCLFAPDEVEEHNVDQIQKYLASVKALVVVDSIIYDPNTHHMIGYVEFQVDEKGYRIWDR